MAIKEVLVNAKTVVYPAAASVAHARGDLLYFDSSNNTADSAGEQADQLSQLANQRLFAANFAGVNQDVRIAAQTTAGTMVVVTDGVYDCGCDSATFKIGDMVAAQETGAGTALENQKVIATTDPSAMIGVVVADVPVAATTVRCRLVARVERLPVMPGFAAGLGGTVTQITNRSTGVTLNKLTGQITTDATSLAAGAEATFTVTNTTVLAKDVVVIACKGGQTAGTSVPMVTAVADGSFDITLTNLHASTADTGAMVINFAVVRGQTA